jgi:hypothetical protein
MFVETEAARIGGSLSPSVDSWQGDALDGDSPRGALRAIDTARYQTKEGIPIC